MPIEDAYRSRAPIAASIAFNTNQRQSHGQAIRMETEKANHSHMADGGKCAAQTKRPDNILDKYARLFGQHTQSVVAQLRLVSYAEYTGVGCFTGGDWTKCRT